MDRHGGALDHPLPAMVSTAFRARMVDQIQKFWPILDCERSKTLRHPNRLLGIQGGRDDGVLERVPPLLGCELHYHMSEN